MLKEVLIQRIFLGHEHYQRVTARPSGSTSLLPQGRQSPWIPGDNDSVHPRNVYTQLQGIRRDDRSHRAVLQFGLDTSSVLGKVPSPIRGNPSPASYPVLGMGRNDLCQRTRGDETDRL